ncbi:uncharacterized protein LOC120744657 [Simochromis diagramma]|uniref:uncharacterized protein LOC120744657 n=1 Tax=Simochromis diagramma TaxID=43689 RepID=UPI001A7EEBDA|nr:uncharacterized protein LOC120744657 [Simochromis diagramma]
MENDIFLCKQMLHSIFFLGNIMQTSVSPEDITPDTEIFQNLRQDYRRPFELYSTHLPRRSPFSCVLDMVVLQKNPENEEQIKNSLQDLVNSLESNLLVSSTICISQNNNSSARYYGVSMSTKGSNPGKIVIGASCLSKWHEYVSGAVMTYYPVMVRKTYFDGTIQVPGNIRCEAFNIKNGGQLPPCRSCHKLFGLNTKETKEWDYGNCAEPESLSNLLTNEDEVKNKTHVHEHSAEKRQRAKEEVRKDLMSMLRTIQFKKWTGEFYTPESE